MNNYQELLSQKAALERQAAEIERQLADARRAERSSVVARVNALLKEHGLTAADLGTGAIGRSNKKSALSGQPVAPKYRDVATGLTWSGRGLKPKWVQAALTAGKTLDELKI